MDQELLIRMDEFGCRALESFARRRSGSPGTAVRTASLYYLADRNAGRSTWRVPSFVATDRARDGNVIELRIEVDSKTWEAVAGEADSQGVSAEALVEHAIIYFLADLDSGRAADRLDEVLGAK